MYSDLVHTPRYDRQVAEWSKAHDWNSCRCNSLEGSNPFLPAIFSLSKTDYYLGFTYLVYTNATILSLISRQVIYETIYVYAHIVPLFCIERMQQLRTLRPF